MHSEQPHRKTWLVSLIWLSALVNSLAPAAPAQPTRVGVSTTPVDIVLVVDNSNSMGASIAALVSGLPAFAARLVEMNLDFQFIVVSRHGDAATESMCIEEPLSSIPDGGCVSPPPMPGNTAFFKHYSVEVGSHDGWCLLQSTFDGTTPDEFGLGPNGWTSWLRAGAPLAMIMVGDDGVACGEYNDMNSVNGGAQTADTIDQDLLALSPQHFGNASERNYWVHSLVGMPENVPASEPYLPSAPVSASSCDGAVDPGTGHQSMSVGTGGLRASVCSTAAYPAVLEQVAVEIASVAALFADRFESGDPSEWSRVSP